MNQSINIQTASKIQELSELINSQAIIIESQKIEIAMLKEHLTKTIADLVAVEKRHCEVVAQIVIPESFHTTD